MQFSEIGRAVGISRVAVRHRIEQMEKNGIIRGYYAKIDLKAIPKGIRFILDIEAEPGCYAEVIETLAASSMLHEIYGTSGKSHIHVMGVAPNNETLGRYANYLYRTTKGIRELNWQILVITYKNMERGTEYVQYQESEHLEEGGAKNTES
ncbi:MAG: Lrp/AsnC family transcriptional regulator [Lachnospiraceae bacterium]|nr:Lrp/AsnC family transcriptional regulator [Lachnospiraceae bacterium]